MKYSHTPEQSAEFLRLAIPLMSRQDTAMHPISYAVWYEYVAGTNQALRKHVDELCRDGSRLDEAATESIYREFIAEISFASAQQISTDILHVLDAMNQTTAQAKDETTRYGARIQDWSQAISAPSKTLIADMQSETLHMQNAMQTLQTQLQASQAEIARLEEEVTEARTEAMFDGLTNLDNRRSFDQTLSRLVSEQGDETHSLMMIDIDHFKNINDKFGHTFGDRVIKSVADILKTNIKGSDLAARYGGEEFAVLLPNTPVQGAYFLAEKIRNCIAACRIRRNGETDALAVVTISIGVGTRQADESPETFVTRVDAALYASKHAGRNRVTLCEGDSPPVLQQRRA